MHAYIRGFVQYSFISIKMLELHIEKGLIFFFSLGCSLEIPVCFNKSPQKTVLRICIKEAHSEICIVCGFIYLIFLLI